MELFLVSSFLLYLDGLFAERARGTYLQTANGSTCGVLGLLHRASLQPFDLASLISVRKFHLLLVVDGRGVHLQLRATS